MCPSRPSFFVSSCASVCLLHALRIQVQCVFVYSILQSQMSITTNSVYHILLHTAHTLSTILLYCFPICLQHPYYTLLHSMHLRITLPSFCIHLCCFFSFSLSPYQLDKPDSVEGTSSFSSRSRHEGGGIPKTRRAAGYRPDYLIDSSDSHDAENNKGQSILLCRSNLNPLYNKPVSLTCLCL